MVSGTMLLPSFKHTIHSNRRENKAFVYWVSEAGGMRTPPGLRPTWSTRRLFEAFSPSPSSSHHGMSEGHVWTFEAGCVVGWDGMGRVGGWTESPNERGEEGSLPFSPTRPPDVSQFYFLSVFHLTVQMWADEVASCSENKGTLGMFHSIRKHAEHRTLNTYTQQLVLSKCRFFWGVFWVLFSDTE